MLIMDEKDDIQEEEDGWIYMDDKSRRRID